MNKVSFIGLGQMGGAQALRLHSSGVSIVGFDTSKEARDRCENCGLPVRDSLSEALRDCDTVMTCLPNSAIVSSVWLGTDALESLVRPGMLLIELSSIAPATMRDVGAALEEKGAHVVDCPVSGSPQEATAGKLVLIAGGRPQAVEQARALLEHLGTIRVAGGIGAAKVIKIVNNMMSMANVAAASEAFVLATQAGVDPRVLFDVLSVSGGRSGQFLKRFPWVLEGDYAPRFKLELGEKDLSLGTDLGRELGMPTPIASLVREMCALAMAEGLKGQDIVALHKMYSQWCTART